MEPRWSQPPGPRLCSPHCSACSPPSFPFQSCFHTQLMIAKSSDSLKPGVCRTFQHMSAPFQMSAGTDECRASNAKIKHLCVPPPGVPRCYYPTLLCRLPSDQLIVLFDCTMASTVALLPLKFQCFDLLSFIQRSSQKQTRTSGDVGMLRNLLSLH